MGSIARGNRCERFIREFGKELVAQQAVKEGMLLKVVSVGLGMDPNDEVVKPYVLLKVDGPAGGDEFEMALPAILFEPEAADVDTIDNTVHVLLPPEDWESYEKGEQVKKRLKKAELIDR